MFLNPKTDEDGNKAFCGVKFCPLGIVCNYP